MGNSCSYSHFTLMQSNELWQRNIKANAALFEVRLHYSNDCFECWKHGIFIFGDIGLWIGHHEKIFSKPTPSQDTSYYLGNAKTFEN